MAALRSLLRSSSLVLSVMLVAPAGLCAAENDDMTALISTTSAMTAAPANAQSALLPGPKISATPAIAPATALPVPAVAAAPAPAAATTAAAVTTPATIPALTVAAAPVATPVVISLAAPAAAALAPSADAPTNQKNKKKKKTGRLPQTSLDDDDLANTQDFQEPGLSGDHLAIEELLNMPVNEPKPPSLSDITLENAIVMALKNSPERDIATAQTNQAHYAVDEAKSNYYPQINLRAEIGREYNDPFSLRAGATDYTGYNYGNQKNANVRMMLFDGFSTRETVKQRLQLVESANLSRDKVGEELISFTTQVYMDLWHFQSLVVASKENLDALTEIGALINKRVAAGDASKVEQNYIQARLSSAEKDHLSAQASLKDAFSALTYLIGDVKEFDAAPPSHNAYSVQDVEALLERAVAQNTDMRLLASDKKAADHELNAAKSKFLPSVDVVADASHSNDLGGFTGVHRNASVQLQINYKLFDGGLRQATTSREQEKLRELTAKETRLSREIRQNVRKAYNRRQTVLEQMQVVKEEIKANSDLEALYRKQFEQGELEFIQLVESQERIFAAQTKKIQLETDLVNVTFDLMRATSDLLPKFCTGTSGTC